MACHKGIRHLPIKGSVIHHKQIVDGKHIYDTAPIIAVKASTRAFDPQRLLEMRLHIDGLEIPFLGIFGIAAKGVNSCNGMPNRHIARHQIARFDGKGRHLADVTVMVYLDGRKASRARALLGLLLAENLQTVVEVEIVMLPKIGVKPLKRREQRVKIFVILFSGQIIQPQRLLGKAKAGKRVVSSRHGTVMTADPIGKTTVLPLGSQKRYDRVHSRLGVVSREGGGAQHLGVERHRLGTRGCGQHPAVAKRLDRGQKYPLGAVIDRLQILVIRDKRCRGFYHFGYSFPCFILGRYRKALPRRGHCSHSRTHVR